MKRFFFDNLLSKRSCWQPSLRKSWEIQQAIPKGFSRSTCCKNSIFFHLLVGNGRLLFSQNNLLTMMFVEFWQCAGNATDPWHSIAIGSNVLMDRCHWAPNIGNSPSPNTYDQHIGSSCLKNVGLYPLFPCNCKLHRSLLYFRKNSPISAFCVHYCCWFKKNFSI